MQLSIAMKEYKLQSGNINFPKLFSIPGGDRLYGLVQRMGYEQVHKIIGGAIQVAMENINCSNPITAGQIFELVDMILESSSEDFLAIEDVILFLQKLVRGEMGTLFSRMDVPTFMQMFEKYRQERHEEIIRIRDEESAQFKTLGTNGPKLPRIDIDRDIDPSTFLDLMQTMYEEKRENHE